MSQDIQPHYLPHAVPGQVEFAVRIRVVFWVDAGACHSIPLPVIDAFLFAMIFDLRSELCPKLKLPLTQVKQKLLIVKLELYIETLFRCVCDQVVQDESLQWTGFTRLLPDCIDHSCLSSHMRFKSVALIGQSKKPCSEQ